MDYSKLKVNQLKEELQKRNLRVSGLKQEMISRLKEADKMYTDSLRRPPVSQLIKNGPAPHSDDPLEFVHQSSHFEIREKRRKDREERAMITLWRKPLTTLQYFFFELCIMLVGWIHRLWLNRKKVMVTILLMLGLLIVYNLEGRHQTFVTKFQKDVAWCTYWVVLGIMSSVGLGTGLHTFLLYLGPHIASVTIAAFECMSVDFPEPPFPDEIICPDKRGDAMSIWMVLSKVRVAACMWGAGTALGELPPYFMAKAARLSGEEPDDEDYEEFEDFLEHQGDADQSLVTRVKLFMNKLVHQAGFLGIMACASIPNPLFDLAGITCGHFLVPFWTFFGATLIGKAIIKVHIQQLFVIIAFSEHHVEMVVDLIGKVPYIGPLLQAPFRESLAKQKEKLHHKGTSNISQKNSWLSWLFEKLIIAMIIYFILSIVNSMAQRYAKRLQDKSKDKCH